ncbi:MAG: hypothetical protein IH972_06845, partial [Candidatus Marinimicrobia bacterium]|nr:hypothetical protein [Candidatus Neomarinimicrobiota bacterium]
MKRPLAIALLVLQCVLTAQWWTLEDLISDTLQVQLIDSGAVAPEQAIYVLDNRAKGGKYLGVRQIDKLMFIPVDQYLFADYPVADYLESNIALKPGQALVIDYLDLWHKGGPPLKKGWILNGYTYEADSSGQKIRDWQWEIRIKKIRKEPLEKSLERLVNAWMADQKAALSRDSYDRLSPRRYRRQIVTWVDIIILSDGSTVLDGRLSLPYPIDQRKSYTASIPGIYYRKGKY